MIFRNPASRTGTKPESQWHKRKYRNRLVISCLGPYTFAFEIG